MASYNGSIDLLSLNGAKMFTGIDPENVKRAYVCIPVDLNEIKFTTAKNNPERQIAGLRVNMWPLGEAYKAKVRQSALERGDVNVSVPTHEMQISYTTDFVKSIIQRMPRLVEEVKEANKERDPDIVNQKATDENTHLFKAIRSRMCKRIAMMYQPQVQSVTSPVYPQTAYNVAGNATAYVPPATETGTDLSGIDCESDLPF